MRYALGPDLIQSLGVTRESPWCAGGPVFTVVADGTVITARDVVTGSSTYEEPGDGVSEQVVSCRSASGLTIDWHLRRYAGPAVAETWVGVTNRGSRAVEIERLDSLGLRLVPGEYELSWFTGAWGAEFDPVQEKLSGDRVLQTVSGRSSQGMHPVATLDRGDGTLLRICVAWSGNWVLRFEREPDGGRLVTGGLHDEGFAKTLLPGARIEAPPVVVALSADPGLDLGRAGRRHWAPSTGDPEFPPVEWNPWWPYEDQGIDERTFLANADVAADLGVELCTLDAGWFGTDGWWESRGDWDRANPKRFPGGIPALAEQVHARGMRFGLWCEIEAVASTSRLAAFKPDFPAGRGGEPLGYVCLANPAAADWAFRTLDRLAREGVDWIKLDFNLDPGLGCDRVDHGHGPGDGLFEHYAAYYRVLDRVRRAHPGVVLESCSSGGLRIDLGMLRRTHLTFLSDPDWPEHGLRVLWGALSMLPASQLLHWGFSQWRSEHREQTFDPGGLAAYRIDYYRRIAMLGATGMSYRLPELPDDLRAQLASSIALYKDVVRPFVRDADVHRLTDQPGPGSRWAAFQYALGEDHLVFAFRLPGGEPGYAVRLRGLDPGAEYDVEPADGAPACCRTGADLMTRGLVTDGPEESSRIWRIRARRNHTNRSDG